MEKKFIIYQILPRVFGNTNENCVPGGSLQLNGTGKFSSITPRVLKHIKSLSATHVWFTGVIEHLTKTSFEEFGIVKDNPAVIKGEAGSPYAIKDYYDVNPYLADSVPNRMEEFESLVERTHKMGLKVIIDFIPNHLARGYNSDSTPQGVEKFGEADNVNLSFSPDNNFYYIQSQKLDISNFSSGGVFEEYPAKATGNDCFSAAPGKNDWYETVKLDYGVDYCGGCVKHFNPRPRTWGMMLSVLQFWAAKGVDAFRCDMAEMVPVEFWNWAIAELKKDYPEIKFIAEVYNPAQYKSYIEFGGFDYLYDKVGLYDNLKAITQSHTGYPNPIWYSGANSITKNWQSLGDLQHKMLNFLENHDEQRVASDFNIGDGFKAIPELTVSLMLNTAPFMIYFGQEFGERGMLQEGFSGLDGRTSIFDYCSAPSVVRWHNSQLQDNEKKLLEVYKRVFSIAMGEEAIYSGKTFDLEYANNCSNCFNCDACFAFARSSSSKEFILVVTDFTQCLNNVAVSLPGHLFSYLSLNCGEYGVKDLLSGVELENTALSQNGVVKVGLDKYGIGILKFSSL